MRGGEVFTAGELLFKLHNAVVGNLCDSVHHRFEGVTTSWQRGGRPDVSASPRLDGGVMLRHPQRSTSPRRRTAPHPILGFPRNDARRYICRHDAN